MFEAVLHVIASASTPVTGPYMNFKENTLSSTTQEKHRG